MVIALGSDEARNEAMGTSNRIPNIEVCWGLNTLDYCMCQLRAIPMPNSVPEIIW